MFIKNKILYFAVICYSLNNDCFDKRNISFSSDLECVFSKICECSDNNDIASYIFKLGPYLYPFVVEYSFIAAAVLFAMWKNIGKNPR